MPGNNLTGSPTTRRAIASRSHSDQENIKGGPEGLANFKESRGSTPGNQPMTALSTASSINQSYPQMPLNHEVASSSKSKTAAVDVNPLDKLLAKLSDQQAVLSKQNEAFKTAEKDGKRLQVPDNLHAMKPMPVVPIVSGPEGFKANAPTTRPATSSITEGMTNKDEILRLKLELAQAQNKISRLEGMSQNQPLKGELGSFARPIYDTSVTGASEGNNRFASMASSASTTPAPFLRETSNGWSNIEDGNSDTSDALSASGFNRSRGIWNQWKDPVQNLNNQPPNAYMMHGALQPPNLRNSTQVYSDPMGPYQFSGLEGMRSDSVLAGHGFSSRPFTGRRGGRFDSHFGTPHFGNHPPQTGHSWSNSHYENGSGTYAGPSQPPVVLSNPSGNQQNPIGTPLSPFAHEFTSFGSGGPWKSEPVATEGQTYMPTTEPLNYRRLLDRNVNCNWKYIVDKIVCNNDQQASIFLQQKLKVGTPDQKYEIVEAIVLQAHPLMVNRFGNFLVQRCFEHGTPEQVIKIAECIRGNTLSLSMDPFGCHVVQKAFDSVPEDYKAIMVHELLRRIPETVIHRYACHVWQKLFELRWTESPPQIMKYVNEALHGMWHEVALGETGSLVVQNIFENCLEEDKRPCIEEVLANIDIVAHGQFGNWCIQHVCEHGSPADRSRAIDHVIRFAAEYSMDQYASKVVEKCLKTRGSDFLGRYLDRLCEGRIDRPRIPLIDVSSDQYGNYLIQWILTHGSPQHREIVTAHIRKHMVSLRGSKFGSRVGMLCTNPAVATRPGPGVGTNLGRGTGPQRFGRPYP